MLRRLGVRAVEVRQARELEKIDGLIIPGGESTAMGSIAVRWGLVRHCGPCPVRALRA